MKKSLILITVICTLITLTSCSNMLEDLRNAKNKRNAKGNTGIEIKSTQDEKKKTNRVTITVDPGDKEIDKTGYVFTEPETDTEPQTKKEWKDADEVFTDEGFKEVKKDSDGKYTITADKNGDYTVAVKDKGGNTTYKTVTVDSIIPVDVNIPEVSINKKGEPFDVTITGLEIAAEDFDKDGFTIVCTDSSGNEVPEVTSGAAVKRNDDGTITVSLTIPQNKGEYEITIECNTKKYGDVYLNGTLSVDIIYYKVTFNTDGGNTVEEKSVEEGKTVQKPDDPKKTAEKTSFVFLGWYNGETAYDFSAAVNDNLNLTAKWLEGFVNVEGSTVEGGDKFIYSNTTSSSDCWNGVFRKGRTVEIGDFYMCDHEVTQGEYEEYCLYYKSPDDKYGKEADYPAYYVSWYDAVIYCNLRSESEGLKPVYYLADKNGNEITDVDGKTNGRKISAWRATLGNNDSIIKMTENKGVKKYCYAGGYNADNRSRLDYTGNDDTDGGICFDQTANGYRLPTEAEWEYAARGGKKGVEKTDLDKWAGTNNETDLENYAWYSVNSGSQTHIVKSDKKTNIDSANLLGLYDMSGNVWEWCWDWYDYENTPSITAVTPAAGVVSGSDRVLRGGSWYSYADDCSVARRCNDYPSVRSKLLGFRVVRSAQ